MFSLNSPDMSWNIFKKEMDRDGLLHASGPRKMERQELEIQLTTN
jgi:hypothetical protein